MLSSLKIRTKRGAVLAGLGALVLSLNMHGYFTWRMDQPPDNPGGPLEGLGPGVTLWSVLVHVSPFLMMPLVGAVVDFLTPDAARANPRFRACALLIAAATLFAPFLMLRPFSLRAAVVALTTLSMGLLVLRALARKAPG